jgi:Family of unknown function (DUF6165)
MIIEISIGEAFDRLTILKIKSEKIKDESKLANVMKEYFYLQNLLNEELEVNQENEDFKRLLEINENLWEVEDLLREYEENKSFNDKFIQLARLVYVLNDKRARVKKEINLAYGSEFVEEKSYNQL